MGKILLSSLMPLLVFRLVLRLQQHYTKKNTRQFPIEFQLLPLVASPQVFERYLPWVDFASFLAWSYFPASELAWTRSISTLFF